MAEIKNIIGQKFGKLTVIEKANKPKNIKERRIYWLCRCDCGNEKIVSGHDLKSGDTQSCGCLRFTDLSDKKIGRLQVIKAINTSDYNVSDYIKNSLKTYWLCKCDCGNEKIVSTSDLNSRKIQSCGCYNKESHRLTYGEASKNIVYAQYKYGAKRRNISFNLSKEEFFEIVIQNCFYCGSEPSNNAKSKWSNGDFVYNGIDRIDSFKGYIIENIVPCCWKCNNAKNNISLDDFDKWIEKVYKHRISLLTK